jgi:hypothetical protein
MQKRLNDEEFQAMTMTEVICLLALTTILAAPLGLLIIRASAGLF